MQPVSDAIEGSPQITRRPCPLQARAWWGDQLLADSTSAVRVEEAGQPPALYFPLADVRVALFDDEGRVARCPVKGLAHLWTVPGSAPPAWAGSWHGEALPSIVDGRGAAWTFSEPAAELPWLSGMAAFDHERVRVEVVDPLGSSDPRDVTTKQFPTWGDVTDLADILLVRRDGECRFVSEGPADSARPVVEGSQMLGQAIVAAGRQVPGRRVVSAHMVFVRAADARLPLAFELDEISNGRTFTTLGVRVVQEGRLRATGTLLLDAMAPDLIRHAVPAPAVTGPYDSVPYDMGVTGRDLRVVDAAYSDDPQAPVGPPVIDAWVRFAPLDDDPPLHAGLLAQFTGHMSIAAAMRPYAGIGQSQAHRTLSTGINAISLSLHGDIRADRWMLYHHLSTFAGDGMTHAECRVHDEAGALLASFTVDAMVRGFADPQRAVDDRTAI